MSAGTSSAATGTSREEDALIRCGLSKSYLEAGDYERAREAMGALWRRAGDRPETEGLGARAAAEVLAHAGRLTSAIGGAHRVEGAQEAAKNLLSEGAALFERLGEVRKVAEAQADLALCYWREGAFEEARVILRSALGLLSQDGGDQRAAALVRLSIVEFSARRLETALEHLEEAAPLVEASESDNLKGCFHSQLAVTFRALADAGGGGETRDRALVEYAAASYHFERAGHKRYQANTENNLAFLYNNIGRYEEARHHLARARALSTALKDTASVAQYDDTLARILIAEGRLEEAERAAAAAVRGFESGDRQALLAEALTTLGVAQARAGRRAEARRSFARAVEASEAAGDRSGAGAAALALAEELGQHMEPREACEAFARAHDLLSDSRDPATLARLAACARRAVDALPASDGSRDESAEAPAPLVEGWEGFSLKAEVLRYESKLIARALRDAEGVVSRAAKLLGFRHHQTFVALLNNRHKELLHARRPAIPRRRSIVQRRKSRHTPEGRK